MLRRSDFDSSWAIDADLLLRMSTQNCLEKLNSQRAQTPLSAKSYVITPEQFCPTTPVSISTHRAQKLAELLKVDYRQTIDSEFDSLMAQSANSPRAFISERVAQLEER